MMRIYVKTILLTITVIASLGMSQLFYLYFNSQELSNAQGRLSLYQASLTSELERFAHMTYILARHPLVVSTTRSTDTQPLNQTLAAFAKQAEVEAIYLMGKDGITIAASNAKQQDSFIGQDYSFRPYFKSALQGQHGRFYAIGATTGLPGYFIADAVHNENDDVVGVVAIKINLSTLQDSWAKSGEQVLLSNADGVILLTSERRWLYQVMTPLTPQQRVSIQASKQFIGEPLLPLNWRDNGNDHVTIDGSERLHVTSTELPHQWQLHYFFSDARAKAFGWLVTTVFLVLIGIVLAVYQRQQHKQATLALKRSEKKEAQLRTTNAQLEIEIIERNSAEQQLRRTQNELERTSRLAALGRLSAIVTHELGQPIAAMRNYLVADEINTGQQTKLTNNIGDLVYRMEGITQQLKFFASKQDNDFNPVNIAQAMQNAIKLVTPNAQKTAATIDIKLASQPLVVRGNQLRLEQVMTNILRNAIDAVGSSIIRTIQIRMGSTLDKVWFEVTDSGHGIGDATLNDLQAPFVSTRESGHGMGLGLAISADIIKDHDGVMSAHNHSGHEGAIFRVELPIYKSSGSKGTQ